MAAVDPVSVATMIGMNVAQQALTGKEDKSARNAQAQAYQTRIDEMNARYAQAEQDNQRNHKIASARQRALFAAQGINQGDGSSSAVMGGLLGLTQATSQDLAQQQRYAQQGAYDSFSNAVTSNLLTKKTSLVQDNLDRLLSWKTPKLSDIWKPTPGTI